MKPDCSAVLLLGDPVLHVCSVRQCTFESQNAEFKSQLDISTCMCSQDHYLNPLLPRFPQRARRDDNSYYLLESWRDIWHILHITNIIRMLALTLLVPNLQNETPFPLSWGRASFRLTVSYRTKCSYVLRDTGLFKDAEDCALSR